MHLWNMLREGGWPALLAAFIGVLALVIGVVAAFMLLFSKRAAFVLGMVTLVMAMSAGSLGALGVPLGRHQVERALGGISVDPSQVARIQEEGYSEAAASGRVGAGAAFVPALLGALAAFLGAGGGSPQPPAPAYPGGPFAPAPLPAAGDSSRTRYLLAALASAMALLALVAALVAGMSAPYPNPHQPSAEAEF